MLLLIEMVRKVGIVKKSVVAGILVEPLDARQEIALQLEWIRTLPWARFAVQAFNLRFPSRAETSGIPFVIDLRFLKFVRRPPLLGSDPGLNLVHYLKVEVPPPYYPLDPYRSSDLASSHRSLCLLSRHPAFEKPLNKINSSNLCFHRMHC